MSSTPSSSPRRPAENITTPEKLRSQVPSHGYSTPKSGHRHCSFVPSDISSVASSSSLEASPGKRDRQAMETIQEVPNTTPKKTPTTRNTYQGKQSDSVTPKQTRLEQIVSQRLQSFEKSMAKTLRAVQRHASETSENSDTSVDDVVSPRKKYKVYKGTEWKLFKPERENTIYSKVLQCFADVRIEAMKWMQKSEQNSEQAVTDIIQFLVDVCGHQSLDVSTIFNSKTVNFVHVVHVMQDNCPAYQESTGKYLMKSSSNVGKQIHNAIYQFLDYIVEFVYNKDVLNDAILTYLFGFIATLSMSTHKPLLHTGIAIAAKMTTNIMKIVREIENKIQHYLKSRMDVQNRLELCYVKRRNLCRLLTILQNTIEKNCCHPDSSLNGMKVVCIEEMKKWFMMDPSLLSHSKYFRKLLKLVQDPSNHVRMTALTTCYKLIETEAFSNNIEPYMEKFVEVVWGRIYDVDYSVVMSTVKIFTVMIDTYPNAITMKVVGTVPLFVYGKHSPLAIAAGNFLIKYMSSDGEKDAVKTINQLIAFVRKPKMNNCTPLLVESIIDWCPEISNWKLMIDLLLSDGMDYENKKILIHLMCQAIQQTLTGKSKICRLKSYQKQVNSQIARNASEIFLLNLHSLLKKYINDPKCLQMLLEILMIIDFDYISVTRHAIELDNIVSILRPAFFKNTEFEVLKTISNVFARFCDKAFPLRNRYQGRVLTVKQASADTVNNFINSFKQNEDLSEDDLYSIELYLMGLSVLFIYHDMTNFVESALLFDDLMNLNENVYTPNSLKYTITSCYWFLTWQLHQIVDDVSQDKPISDNLQQYINQIKSTSALYIDKCFYFLKNSENAVVRNEAFKCLSDLLLKFQSELKNPLKHNPDLRELIPTLDNIAQPAQLLDFAEALLFQDNSKETLSPRRIALGNMMNLALLNIISVLELSRLYQYYHTHYDDYGDVFDDGLRSLRGCNILTFTGMILQTLVYCYKSFSAEGDEDAPSNEEIDNLRKLSKQFKMFVGRSSAHLNLLLQLGIKYAIVSESRYSFLDFLKYFGEPLSPAERKDILEFLTARLPERSENNQTVKNFIFYMNIKRTAAPLVEWQSDSDATITSKTMEEETEVMETSVSECTESFVVEDYSDV